MSARQQGAWIIDPQQDLLWFQGPVVAGLLLLMAFSVLPPLSGASFTARSPAVLLLLLWGVVFDGTHVMGTYARTWLSPDAEERRASPGVGWWAVLAVGPALAVLDHLWCRPGTSQLGNAGLLFRGFLLVSYLWAYWHLIRQHYGFLVLYQRRAGRVSPTVARAETAALWLGSLYPFLRYSLSPGYAVSGLPVLLPTSVLEPLRIALDLGTGVAGLALVAFLALRARTEGGGLGPRHLFLAVVVSFQVLVFATLQNLLAITAALTIFHDLQYHRIVWQYERGRGRLPLGGLARYLVVGLGFGMLWYGPRVLGVALAPSDLVRNILLGLGWGVAHHHYLVDSRIWRVRRTPGLSRTLEAGATA